MSRAVVLLVLACACAASAQQVPSRPPTISAPDGSTFRRDYYFYEDAEGWLKMHQASAPWHVARLVCRLEGGRLASPINSGLYSTMQKLQQESAHSSVFTGINGMSIGTDYFSVEGVHITQMPLEWKEQADTDGQNQRCLAMDKAGKIYQTSCENEQPFFCYKKKEGIIRMNVCGTIDPAYQREVRTGSCYKFHHAHRATWYQAHTTCAAEGGRLAIINSELEADILSEMSRGYDADVAVGLFSWYRDDQFDQHVWLTVDDKTLDEAGFARWQPGEPNNDGEEYCGAIGWNRNTVGFNDINCNRQVPFICEIERLVIAVPTA